MFAQFGRLVLSLAVPALLCGTLAASNSQLTLPPQALPAEVASDPVSFSKHFGALDGRYPNVVAIFTDDPEGRQQQTCTGILIDDTWVLTVAECVAHRHVMEISVGVGDIDLARAQRVRVTESAVHPNAESGRNAPALLRLETPPGIRLLGVAPFSGSPGETSRYNRYVIVGWGRVPVSPSADSNEQKTFTLRTLPIERCFPEAKPSDLGQLSSSYICTASPYYGLVPCEGFQGAPLIEISGPMPPPAFVREPRASEFSPGVPFATALAVTARCLDSQALQEPVAVFLNIWSYREWVVAQITSRRTDSSINRLEFDGAWRPPPGRLSSRRPSPPIEPPPIIQGVGKPPPPPPPRMSDRQGSALDNDFPFIASIGRTDPDLPPQYRHICSGVVVSRQWVLTAGHCVHDYVGHPTLLYVRVGSVEINAPLSDRVREIAVTKVVMRGGYTPTPLGHYLQDAALLQVETPIPLNVCAERVRSLEEIEPLLQRRQHGLMAGWGSRTTHSEGDVRLGWVQVKLYYPRDVCAAKVPGGLKRLVDDKTVICAGDKRSDAQRGDSGAPLVIADSGPYRVVGLVSWGRESRDPDVPGIYAFLPSHRDWIVETIGADAEAAAFCR